MLVEIALCVGAGAVAVVAGVLVPLLIQLRKPVAESGYLLVRMNAELPVLLKEMRAATENLTLLVEQARGGVEHAAVHGRSRSFLVNLASIVAGFKATTGVVTARIHREGGTHNGR
jgi:hypothetical protein